MFIFIGDVGEQQFQPLRGGQELEVAFQGGVEFGAVDDHARIVVIGHLLQGEGCSDHIAGEAFSAFGINDVKRRIEAASKFVPLENMCISPQCGFASTHEGNKLSEQQQYRKLQLVVEVADEVWS